MEDETQYYSLELPIEAVKLLHKSLSFHHEKWPGGHPEEQENILMMKNNFYRIILEHQFENLW